MAGTAKNPSPLEPLWRHILGRKLRMLRLAQGQKLTDAAGRAGISPQYLSEVERGLKEPSSEMIAAIAGALGFTLLDLTGQVAEELRSVKDFSGADRDGLADVHELGSVRRANSVDRSVRDFGASRVLAFAA